MKDINANDLEEAISKAKGSSSTQNNKENFKMSIEEEKGFHKGSLNTLLAERNELVKIIGNIEAIMQAHINRLKELGVDIKNG